MNEIQLLPNKQFRPTSVTSSSGISLFIAVRQSLANLHMTMAWSRLGFCIAKCFRTRQTFCRISDLLVGRPRQRSSLQWSPCILLHTEFVLLEKISRNLHFENSPSLCYCVKFSVDGLEQLKNLHRFFRSRHKTLARYQLAKQVVQHTSR